MSRGHRRRGYFDADDGLWHDLIAEDGPALIAALERGLATREHADFVARLAANVQGH